MSRFLGWMLIWTLGTPALAQDWPQWRGPNRDGRASGNSLPKRWPKQLKQEWRVEIGEGHSGPIAQGDWIYCFSRQKEAEVVRCLNRSDGTERWKKTYPVAYEVNEAALAHGKGPKSTPVVADGRLFTLGISGILTAWNANNGEQLWQKDFTNQFRITSPLYGTAMSPLVWENQLIAHVGGHDVGSLSAFDVQTGKVLWTANKEGPAYASPVLAIVDHQKMIITQTQKSLLGIDPQNGKTLWESEFITGYDQNSITNVIDQNILIHSGYEKPLQAFDLSTFRNKKGLKHIWSKPALPLYMSSPIVIEDRLFIFSQKKSGQVVCLNLKTGKILWENEGRMGENGSWIGAGKYALLLTTEAKLCVYAAKADTSEPIAEYTLADSPTWSHPALIGNRFLVKDQTHLICWHIEK